MAGDRSYCATEMTPGTFSVPFTHVQYRLVYLNLHWTIFPAELFQDSPDLRSPRFDMRAMRKGGDRAALVQVS